MMLSSTSVALSFVASLPTFRMRVTCVCASGGVLKMSTVCCVLEENSVGVCPIADYV